MGALMSPHEMELLRRIIEALETIASGFKQRVPPVLNPPPKTENGIDNTIQDARLFAQGTGTYGPAPRPAIHPGPGRIPMNVAFREVVQFVTLELKQSGEQWSDQSRQDLVSTIIISAGRQGLLDVWERS